MRQLLLASKLPAYVSGIEAAGLKFIESLVRENLNVANNLLTSAAPWLPDELILIALDPKVKAYARMQAISESYKIMRENVLETKHLHQLQGVGTAP